jgi:hypothetical protein
MNKYYELIFKYDECCIEKIIQEHEISEIGDKTIIMNQFFTEGRPSVFRASINTFSEPKPGDYVEQLKAIVFEWLDKQRDEINKSLEAAKEGEG